MTLNEAIQEMKEHGYQLHKKSKLQEAIDCVKQYGYLVEDEEKESEDDYSDDEDQDIDHGKDHGDASEDASNDVKRLVKDLREINGYEKFVQYLNKLDDRQAKLLKTIVGDGQYAKDTQAKKGSIPVWKLHPTQKEIDIANSLAFPFENKKGTAKGITPILEASSPITINNSPLLVYKHSDGNYYIIDGHHRWSQVALINRKALMNIILFTKVASGNEGPVDVLRDFQAVIKAQTGEVKVAEADHSRNIFKWKPAAIRKWCIDKLYAEAGQPAVDAWQAAKGHEEDDVEAIADTIQENAEQMQKKNMPPEGAPERQYMPQTDKATIQAAAQGMTDV